MKKLSLYWLFLFSLMGKTLWAQDTLRPKIILKTVPTTLIDPDNTLTLGAEIPIATHWSIYQEAGWGNAALSPWEDGKKFASKNNFRFRTQGRYYFSDPYSQRGSWYLAAEYYRKEVFIKEYRALGRGCNPATGGCAYFEEGLVKTRRRVSASHVKAGYQVVVPRRLVIDLYLGGGFRKLLVTNDAEEGTINNWFWNRDLFNFRTLRPGSYETTPSITGGFSLGILLGQRNPKALPLR